MPWRPFTTHSASRRSMFAGSAGLRLVLKFPSGDETLDIDQWFKRDVSSATRSIGAPQALHRELDLAPRKFPPGFNG